MTLIKKLGVVCVTAFVTTACSNNVKTQGQYADPYENVNRKVFAFNNTVDSYALKPVAKLYGKMTPKFVDKSIGNFFANLEDVGNAFNNTLQGKFGNAAEDAQRVAFNSTLGLGGFIDFASAAGIPKNNEDFGQTLATWGVGSGPYLMLPFLGPSTVRDGAARLTVDRATQPTTYSDEGIALFIIETVKTRSDFIASEGFLDDLSEDKYSAIRDLWINNRKSLIVDGKVDEDSSSDLIDELESLEKK